jgi:hypothetical protein
MFDDDLFADTPELCGPADPVPVRRQRLIDGPLRNAYRLKREAHRARCAAVLAPCGICKQGIDYGLRHGDPRAYELDHVQPVETHPELALEPSNFQPSHSVCNKRKALLQGIEGVGGSAYVSEDDERPDDERPGGTRVIDGITVEWDPEWGYPSEVW